MNSKFRKMDDTQFRAYSPKTEAEYEDYIAEKAFREWCEENQHDPTADEAREMYAEETNSESWEDMDEHDADGWEHNMNKD